jgi:hypothetical protein
VYLLAVVDQLQLVQSDQYLATALQHQLQLHLM